MIILFLYIKSYHPIKLKISQIKTNYTLFKHFIRIYLNIPI